MLFSFVLAKPRAIKWGEYSITSAKPDWTPCEVYTTHYSVNVTIWKKTPTNLAEKKKTNKQTKQNKTVERQLWREHTGELNND